MGATSNFHSAPVYVPKKRCAAKIDSGLLVHDPQHHGDSQATEQEDEKLRHRRKRGVHPDSISKDDGA
ncbi:hypothetical protein GJ744_009260 [Endocarpon pusillum]|uniref:Uncharacterized protein n=1 Tax=Endocarpon pusillum TaxID=364733 RepID=A0A8H7E3V9_9EURO|nr:hypothetical protein GJ744_009260 [Endocarpon pusillum]